MAINKGENTVTAVSDCVRPIVEGLGLRLWDVRYQKEGAQWYLRVFIDKDGSVDINDCEKVSRAVDAPIEQLDPIDTNYILEVCSPGLERELIRDEHFLQFVGANVKVKMIRPIDSIGKEFCGVLMSYDKGKVTIQDHSKENEIVIDKKDAAWIKLDDFD